MNDQRARVAAVAPPRPDPFALPSQTTARFLLLIVSAVGAALFAFNIVYFSLVPDGGQERDLYVRCSVGRGHASTGPDAVVQFAECVAPYERAKGLWILGGVLVLLVVAAVIYWWTPAWQIRHQRLTPLTTEDSPDLARELAALVQRARLDKPPAFLLRISNTTGGLAFGRLGRRYIRLDAGLIVCFTTDRARFRTVVLHELAHLRNRDVDLCYLTIAVWRAFVLVALAPLTVSIADEGLWVGMGVGLRMLVLIAVVYLTGCAVLRTREVYADVRASQWADRHEVRAVLGWPRENSDRPWRQLTRTHPSHAVRQRTLDDTSLLFNPGFWEAFGTGLAIMTVYGNAVTVVWMLRGGSDPLANRWLAALVLAPLAMGVIGIAVWRAVAWAAARGATPPRMLLPGVGMGSGLLLGQPLAASNAMIETWSAPAGVTPITAALSFLVLIATPYLLIRWLSSTACAWLPTAKGPTLAPLYVPITAAAAGLLTLWLGTYALLMDMPEAFAAETDMVWAEHQAVGVFPWDGPTWLWQLHSHPFLRYLSTRDLLLLGLIAIWLIPVSGYVVRGRFLDSGPPLWMTRLWHSVPHHRESVPARPAGLGFAVAAGTVSAVTFEILLLAIRIRMHREYPARIRELPQFLLSYQHMQLILVIVFQALAAAAVTTRLAFRLRPLPVALGLLASFVASVLMGLAIMFTLGLSGCVEAISIRPGPCSWQIPTSFIDSTMRNVLISGVVPSTMTSLIGAGIGALLARHRCSQ